MANKYYYLIASLPTLSIGGATRVTRDDFLYECAKWLPPADMEAVHAADLSGGASEEKASETMKKLISMDYELREMLAVTRAALKKGESPRVPDVLRPVMEAETPLDMETELARVRWRFLDAVEAEHFFDINWLVVYFLKVQLLERLASFDKDTGEARFYKLCEVQYEQTVG